MIKSFKQFVKEAATWNVSPEDIKKLHDIRIRMKSKKSSNGNTASDEQEHDSIIKKYGTNEGAQQHRHIDDEGSGPAASIAKSRKSGQIHSMDYIPRGQKSQMTVHTLAKDHDVYRVFHGIKAPAKTHFTKNGKTTTQQPEHADMLRKVGKPQFVKDK